MAHFLKKRNATYYTCAQSNEALDTIVSCADYKCAVMMTLDS